MCCFIGYPCHVLLKKIVIEDNRDAQKQLRVNSRPLKELVNIGAVAIELACEPADSSFLPLELFLDSLPYMQRWQLGLFVSVHRLDEV